MQKILPVIFLVLSNFVFAKDDLFKHFEKELSVLKVKTTKGNSINFAKIKEPIIILNFWASWCRPCVSEFASLKKFIKKVGRKNVFVLGINNDDEKPYKNVKKIEKKYELPFESVLDETTNLTDKFRVSRVPTSIVFYNRKVIEHITEEYDFMNKSLMRRIGLQL
ncbi:MAG: TlpA family protein disulfide reductase [Bacteriovoracaceae bacterium]|jgi:thiol-disulfide isomerase/thioredoxin|nr:TlpA family protein disulfide reductase [Bacteriovoracaceae bacterium]